MKHLPTIRPLKQEEYEPLKEVAKADNHQLLFPTHIVRGDSGILGYASVCATPILNLWLDSKRVGAREGILVLNTIEQGLRMAGREAIVAPCAQESPFYQHIEKLGYECLGHTTLNLKKL